MTKEEKTELIIKLGEITEELGWSIIIPVSKTNDKVEGVIIGTKDFLDQVLYRFREHNDEIIYLDKDEKTDEKDNKNKGNNDDDPTFH